MNIEVRRLRHLTAIVDCGTFIRAAATLNMSQPALSKSIALLEHTIGAPVLVRGRNGAVPTSFGLALVGRFKVIEAELRSAARDIEDLKGSDPVSIRLGATPGATCTIVPEIVARFGDQWSWVRIHIHEGTTDVLMNALNEGEIDFAIGPDCHSMSQAGLQHLYLYSDRLVVLTRRGHPLGERDRVRLGELNHYPLVGSGSDTSLNRRISQLFSAAGLTTMRYAITADSPAAAWKLIERSDAFGFYPYRFAAADDRAQVLRLREIDEDENSYEHGVGWRPGLHLTLIFQSFLDFLKTQMAASPDP